MDDRGGSGAAASGGWASLARWPRRRRLLAAPAAVVLGAAFRGAGGELQASWWDWGFVLLAAVAGGLLVASYLAVPGSGRVLEAGCSPCASAAAATLPLALMARSAGPDNAGMAVLALALIATGLRQRLSGGTSCGYRP